MSEDLPESDINCIVLLTADVIQIIPPKDLHLCCAKSLVKAIGNRYLVTLQETGTPHSILSYWRWSWKHRRWPYSWIVVVDPCSFKEGDQVTIKVKPLMPAVEFWEAI